MTRGGKFDFEKLKKTESTKKENETTVKIGGVFDNVEGEKGRWCGVDQSRAISSTNRGMEVMKQKK